MSCLRSQVIFTGAFQADRRVRIYNTEKDWQLVKDIHARNLRWTITDTALSKDQSLLLYATINPVVHMVRLPSHSFFVVSAYMYLVVLTDKITLFPHGRSENMANSTLGHKP